MLPIKLLNKLLHIFGFYAALKSQDEAITRNRKRQETESDDDNQALDDVGYNADLYISNQVVKSD